MTKIYLFTLLFATFNVFGQNDKIEGDWILDKTTYCNGDSLEINHPLYSTFIEYEISANSVSINGRKIAAEIGPNTIILNLLKLNYKLIDDFLVVEEKGDNKKQYFLKRENFIKKYPDFEPKRKIIHGDSVSVENIIVKPKFENELTFEDFLRKNIASYSTTSATNNYFKVEFILTNKNEIKNIIILNSISKPFDNECIDAIKKSNIYMKNEYGKDILVTHEFIFCKMLNPLNNKKEKQIFEISKKGNEYFNKNDFTSAIREYEVLKNVDNNDFKNRLGYIIDECFLNLGISYLATNQKDKACETFHSIGDKTNFKVRNYLKSFCE